MKKITMLIILLSVSLLHASGGFGGLFIPYAMPDLETINERIEGYSYNTFSTEGIIGLGGMGVALIDNFIIGGEGFSTNRMTESDSYKLNYTLHSGFFDMGYGYTLLNRFNLMGIIGVGGSGSTLEFTQMTSDVTFDSLLVDPGRLSKISYTSFSFNLSAGIQVFEMGADFVHILLRGGVIYQINDPNWKFENGGEVFDGPKMDKAIPYAGLTLLFGGRSK